ncbi:MAG: RdgB/HAM1 family non-canonical purine NTP pyrophosphatase [Alphaproteobacteria bacterium]|nr:RdgB/HAM1 family non-canonical purine NTP pyrophosphatase [Alphaproteobacteria bacterium]
MGRLSGQRLVVATHNAGKLREFAEMLSPLVKEVVSAGDLGLDEPEETGTTFEENAALKALAASVASGSPALADDSGLCVSALNGEPGVFSARWGGEQKDMMVAMRRVNELLGDNPDRSAHFVCALAVTWPNGKTEAVEGRVDGKIVWPPRGDNGYGYDPVFVPDGYDKTFAEMSADEKNKISHRKRAIEKLVIKLSS